MSKVNAETRKTAERVVQVLNHFKAIDDKTDMTISEAIAFMLIVQGETQDGGGLTVTELSQQGNFALASASRYMRSLAMKDRQGNPGHGLVDAHEDPLDARRKVLRVTPKGERSLAKLTNIIEGKK